MKKTQIIKADLFTDNVGTVEQRQNLKEQILEYKGSTKSFANTNDGCWRGEINLNNMAWLEEAIIKNIDEVIEYYLEDDITYSSRFQELESRIESWVNVNEPGSMNRMHSHKEFDYVALYFIQGEGTGELEFNNPANLLTDCSLNSPYVSRFAYEPKDGDLLIWPAWVPHEVQLNKSNKQRINIAFNIKV